MKWASDGQVCYVRRVTRDGTHQRVTVTCAAGDLARVKFDDGDEQWVELEDLLTEEEGLEELEHEVFKKLVPESVYCHCGSRMIDHSPYSDNHAPVEMEER